MSKTKDNLADGQRQPETGKPILDALINASESLDSGSLLAQRPNVAANTRADRLHSISPYPENVTVKGDNVFKNGNYLGYVDKVANWGNDFLARTEDGRPNQFFSTKTKAVNYLIQ